MVFMQDGAAPHYHLDVFRWLDRDFRNRWDQVYRTQPAGLEELKRRIVRAFQETPPDMAQRAMNSYGRRLQRCIKVQGRSLYLLLFGAWDDLKRYAIISALQVDKALAQEDAEVVVLEENVAKKDAQIDVLHGVIVPEDPEVIVLDDLE
uniref:Uncharacterized protein n=1 Tax=Ditylenchus dipsaci TaxID=166011 RepID=A0A915DJC6_9BILA